MRVYMLNKNNSLFFVSFITAFFCAGVCQAGESSAQIVAPQGVAPHIDGVLSEGEWDDAGTFSGMDNWTVMLNDIASPDELSLAGKVKHDGSNLYFAFDITDSYVYGFDTEPWIPEGEDSAHALSREGMPWFGDAFEIMLDAQNKWSSANQSCEGNGKSWQMVVNSYKSILDGVGKGGLSGGEPRSKETAWNTYMDWINSGAMAAAVTPKSNPRGFIIEWKIKANPCLEVSDGTFWSALQGETIMGINFESEDVDRKQDGEGNYCNFNHICTWTAQPADKLKLSAWGTMKLVTYSVSARAMGALRPRLTATKLHTIERFLVNGRRVLPIYRIPGKNSPSCINLSTDNGSLGTGMIVRKPAL